MPPLPIPDADHGWRLLFQETVDVQTDCENLPQAGQHCNAKVAHMSSA